MRRCPALLMATAPLLLAGCGTFVTDSVIEPYKLESYKPLDDAAVVNGVRVSSAMGPKKNHIYDKHGPFSVSIVFGGMRGSGKVAAVRSLEVTGGGETLFSREFTSLSSGYFDHNSPGAQGHSKDIGGVRVTANATLRFYFGDLFRVDYRSGRTVTVRAVVEVRGGGSGETREVVFRHRAKTKRGLWQWYPPT